MTFADPQTAPKIHHGAQALRPVLIAVPFYRDAGLVQRLCASLIGCAEDIRQIAGEVVLFDDLPDFAPQRTALEQCLPEAAAAFPCRVEHNPQNLGFVRTMNRAMQEAVEGRKDLLLLNSDTYVLPGAFPEMQRVAGLDPMIGFVNPRSNNATLATFPRRDGGAELSPQAAYSIFRQAAAKLPSYSYVPTAVGFCLLVRWHILKEFGYFDEIYGRGYNEENDLIMRAGRCGYRAVLANRAFVWHQGQVSFGKTPDLADSLEQTNSAILKGRYPEYERRVGDYFHSAEFHAERLLGALVPDQAGRITIAFDLSSFVAAHNGTFKAGADLLRDCSRMWKDRFALFVLCSPEVFAFHHLADLGVTRCDPHGPEQFAFVFRVGQPYAWNDIERLFLKAPGVGLLMFDTISIDCGHLASRQLFHIWQCALEHSDLISMNSRTTAAQFASRFRFGPETTRIFSFHCLDLADYGFAAGPLSDEEALELPDRPGFVLVVGNHYPHKDVASTSNLLAALLPESRIVALGLAKPGPAGPARPNPYEPATRFALASAGNLLGVAAGQISELGMAYLYANAAIIVFPSHYEGFGMPLLNALAARKPILVRPLPPFLELWTVLGRDPNIHFYQDIDDLQRLLNDRPTWVEANVADAMRGDGARTAGELLAGIEESLGKIDYHRIVARIRAMQLLHELPVLPQVTDETARLLAHKIEAVLRTLLRRAPFLVPPLRMARRLYRGLRRLW